MKTILGKNMGVLEILRWHEAKAETALMEFRDESSALMFLRQFMPDHFVMLSFREFLAEESYSPELSRMSDQDVLEQLAWQLVLGSVRIAALSVTTLALDSKRATAEPEIPAPRPVKPVELDMPSVEEPVPPVMLAQAAVFRQAAESGAPLCGI